MSFSLQKAMAEAKSSSVATALVGLLGVVQPHHLGGASHVRGNGVQLGQPPVAFVKGHHVALGPGEHGPDAIDRISRVRDQRDVPRIEEAEGGMTDALLGPYQRQHLFVGVQCYAEPFFVPLRDGPPHLREAVSLWVTMVGRVLGRAQEAVYDGLRRRDIGGLRFRR